MTEARYALDGIRVLELTNFMAGPFCGMLLADLGADVIKVENPKGGDFTRSAAPFVDGESAGFLAVNRNKRSIALDLKTDRGREIFLDLVRRSDVVIENLRPARRHRFTFICQQTHLAEFGLDARLRDWAPGCEVLGIDRVTEGAACTVLLAKAMIDSGDALMIANCDQYVDVAIDDYLADMDRRDLDGLIMTMKANDPKWSFVGFDEAGRVTTVVEKRVISDEATVGIYNYRHGRDFVAAAEAMIARDLRVNNE